MRVPPPIRTPLFYVLIAGLTLGSAFWPRLAESHGTVATSVSYEREIARILTRRCISCHSERNLAFPLTTYEETRPWARAIQEEVMARHMPPWRAVAGYGKFANDGGLTKREHQTMLAWIDGNGPKTRDQRVILSIDQGITTNEERLKPDFDKWQLGAPDVMLNVGAQAIDATQPAAVVRTTVDLRAKSDWHVRGLEFKPADRRGLRAASFRLEPTGQWLASWTPWYGAVSLPVTAAYRIPAGSRIAAEFYYYGPHDSRQDTGQLGVYFASGTPRHCPSDLVLRADGTVAPKAVSQKFLARATLPSDLRVLALIPTLREGAHALELRARQPNGSVTVLLLVRDLLQDWPTPYLLDAPTLLTAGTELIATAYYSNGSDTVRDGGVDVRVSAYSGSCH
jgi:hypothetical protein